MSDDSRAPDGCPVHFSDPDQTVVLDGMPYTAGLVCLTWHQVAPLREVFVGVLARIAERAEHH
jgi:hypothetical protein